MKMKSRDAPARQCKSSTQPNTQSLALDSAIGLHLLQNPACAQHYDYSACWILAKGRSSYLSFSSQSWLDFFL